MLHGMGSATTPDVSPGPLAALLVRTRSTRALVEGLVADPTALGPDFTAIRALDPADRPDAGAVVGWKATGRGTPGTAVADTLALLDEARRLGLVERLDWAFRCHTFRVAMRAGLTSELHLTPEPETFGTSCPPRLAVDVQRGRRSLDVCAELHDDAFAAPARLRAAVGSMRHEWGWRMVMTDVEDDLVPVATAALGWIQPAYVHFDLSRRRTPGPLQLAAIDHGAAMIAINLDSAARHDAALESGAAFGRGDLVGPARDAPGTSGA